MNLESSAEPEKGRKKQLKQSSDAGLKKDFKSINLETDKEWIKEKHNYNDKQNNERRATFPTWYMAYGKSVGLEYSYLDGNIKIVFRQYLFTDKTSNDNNSEEKKVSTVKLTLDEWRKLCDEFPKLEKVIAAAEGKKKKPSPEDVLGIQDLTANEKGWKKHQYQLVGSLSISVDWNSEGVIVRVKRDYESVMLSACAFSYFKHFLIKRVEKAIEMWEKIEESSNWSFVLMD